MSALVQTATPYLVTDQALAAHQALQARNRMTPPVSVRMVHFGAVFQMDTAPNLLFMRVREDVIDQTVVPIVCVAVNDGTYGELGRVIGLKPTDTVRLVEVVSPLKVRWS